MEIIAMDDIPTPLSSSNLYSFLLLSLMAQPFTPRTEPYFVCEYDYIVVGAGTAGSVVASRLAEIPNASVLLLEAGPSPPPITEVPGISLSFFKSYIDWNYISEPQKNLNNRRIPMAAGRAVGGSGVTNNMLNIRGNPRDYDNWASLGAVGWSFKDVIKYFKKLEGFTVLDYYNEDKNNLYGPQTIERPKYEFLPKTALYESAAVLGYTIWECNTAFQNVYDDTTATIRNGRRCSTAKAYLVPAEKNTNLDIVANAFVNKVNIDNGRAISVEVNFNGTISTVAARKEIILSAGAIHTPKILMLSGIGPKEHLDELKIPVVANLPVGKNYHTHPNVIQPYPINNSIPSLISNIQKDESIIQFMRDGTGPLSSLGGIFASTFLSGNGDTSPNAYPDVELLFYDQNLPGDAIASEYKERVITCVPAILRPKSRGYIRLNSTDANDRPIVEPNYYEDKEDVKKAIEALKLCDKIMATEPLLRIGAHGSLDLQECGCYVKGTDEYYDCEVRYRGATYRHPVGTAKMGHVLDPTTVVDPQLRVKGIIGLRVIDASVMPLTSSGNTNIPTVMIAEKGSDLIKNSF